jgi:uncharacterized membrane protein YbaN (DUF454 family)
MYLLKIILRTIGLAFLAIGIIGILTPIPFGLVFIVVALVFLIPTTPAAVSFVKVLRRRSARFDQAIHGVSYRLPFPFRRILRRTEVIDRF